MRLLKSTILFFICANLWAQTKLDYDFADNEIPELAQFEYYCGVWESEMEVRQKDGTFKKMDALATIIGAFLEDRRTFQSQFSTGKGFFSTDIRTFNTTTNEWNALFLNAKGQRWHKFTSKVVEDKMTTIVKGGYSGKEDFDVKIIDTVIEDSHYSKNVYHSTDQMKTWELAYKMSVKKVK